MAKPAAVTAELHEVRRSLVADTAIQHPHTPAWHACRTCLLQIKSDQSNGPVIRLNAGAHPELAAAADIGVCGGACSRAPPRSNTGAAQSAKGKAHNTISAGRRVAATAAHQKPPPNAVLCPSPAAPPPTLHRPPAAGWLPLPRAGPLARAPHAAAAAAWPVHAQVQGGGCCACSVPPPPPPMCSHMLPICSLVFCQAVCACEFTCSRLSDSALEQASPHALTLQHCPRHLSHPAAPAPDGAGVQAGAPGALHPLAVSL